MSDPIEQGNAGAEALPSAGAAQPTAAASAAPSASATPNGTDIHAQAAAAIERLVLAGGDWSELSRAAKAARKKTKWRRLGEELKKSGPRLAAAAALLAALAFAMSGLLGILSWLRLGAWGQALAQSPYPSLIFRNAGMAQPLTITLGVLIQGVALWTWARHGRAGAAIAVWASLPATLLSAQAMAQGANGDPAAWAWAIAAVAAEIATLGGWAWAVLRKRKTLEKSGFATLCVSTGVGLGLCLMLAVPQGPVDHALMASGRAGSEGWALDKALNLALGDARADSAQNAKRDRQKREAMDAATP